MSQLQKLSHGVSQPGPKSCSDDCEIRDVQHDALSCAAAAGLCHP